MKPLLALLAAGVSLLSTTTAARAQQYLGISVEVTGTAGVSIFGASLDPEFFAHDADPTHLQFDHATIASADGQYTANTTSYGWTLQQPSFSSLADMAASLNQPWVMILDNGLPSQRFYDLSLNLGNLATRNIVPPRIYSPAWLSTIDTLTPVFSVSIPDGNGPMQAQLYHGKATPLPDGSTQFSTIVDDDANLDPGITSWSPSHPLLASTDYGFVMQTENIYVQGGGFSPPAGTDPVNLLSMINISMFTGSNFTTPVPEPTSVLGIAIVTTAICRRRRRQRCYKDPRI